MTTQDCIKHFGSVAELARQLGVTEQAIYQWGTSPPRLRQFQIQHLSAGALSVETSTTTQGVNR